MAGVKFQVTAATEPREILESVVSGRMVQVRRAALDSEDAIRLVAVLALVARSGSNPLADCGPGFPSIKPPELSLNGHGQTIRM